MAELKTCKCGCGGTFEPRIYRGREQEYLRGHNNRGRVRPELRFKGDTPSSRLTHAWSAKKLDFIKVCQWEHLGGCKGRLEVCHIDQDEMNNEPKNLKKLCQAHHRLMDRGKIDPRRPVMPKFRVDKNGRRRYPRTRKAKA